MKLADLKRIPVGTKLRLVHCLMGPCDKPREVLKVQTNAVVMLTPEGKHSWLTLPKASDFRDDEDGFSILESGEVAAQYKFVRS